MPSLKRHRWILRALAAAGSVAAAVLGSGLTASSSGDLSSQIASKQSAATALRHAIAAESAQIRTTTNGLHNAQARLAAVQGQLTARETQLRTVQTELIAARDHLVELENRLQVSSRA